jgi:hypothetical protein
MKFEVKKQIRTLHKELNQQIRDLKSQRKTFPNGYVPGLSVLQIEMRHRHIAYCLMRGTPIEKIESNPAYKHSEFLVNRYTEIYNRMLNPEVAPVEKSIIQEEADMEMKTNRNVFWSCYNTIKRFL